MARYSALIRKLVDATANAEAKGKDVADSLKSRCFNDTTLVRQTLMNAVCDPRFKFLTGTVGCWKNDARHALEQLAEILEGRNPLTEEDATFILDNFLTEWFRLNVDEQQQRTRHTAGTSTTQGEKEDGTIGVLDAVSLLDSFGSQRTEYNNEAEDENVRPEEGDIPKDNFRLSFGEKDETEEADQGATLDNMTPDEANRKEEGDSEMEIPDEQTEKAPGPSANSYNKRLEERFLRYIPRGLMELARQIGRMRKDGNHKAGKFLKAGKTDIAGITTGSDLTALLPTEVAMLADSRTQDVFYRNLTAGRLQLFASASQSCHSSKHQDGPVIICIDTSSSMNGEPIMVAKALTAAVAVIAWRMKRNVVVVKYSTRYEYRDFGTKRTSFGDLAEFLSIVSMGGNDENAMFQWFFRDIEPQLPDYDTADILCISDFGWTTLYDTTRDIIEERKAKGMKFYGLNVAYDFGDLWQRGGDDYNSMDVCDSVWTFEHGDCKKVY